MIVGNRHGLLHLAEALDRPWEGERERTFQLGRPDSEFKVFRVRATAWKGVMISILGDELELDLGPNPMQQFTRPILELVDTNGGMCQLHWGVRRCLQITVKLVGTQTIGENGS